MCNMKTANVRQLRHDFGSVLNWITEGQQVEIVKKGGVFSSEGREATRALAAEVLGELGSARESAAALQEVGQTRRGVTDETRAAATAAASAILARVAEGRSA